MAKKQQAVEQARADFKIAEERKKMIDFVERGCTPGNAAEAAGVSEDWEADDDFRRYIARLHAANKCKAEEKFFKKIADAEHDVPLADLKFYLGAHAGWNEKEAESPFKQNITIVEETVDGTAPASETEREEVKRQHEKGGNENPVEANA